MLSDVSGTFVVGFICIIITGAQSVFMANEIIFIEDRKQTGSLAHPVEDKSIEK